MSELGRQRRQVHKHHWHQCYRFFYMPPGAPAQRFFLYIYIVRSTIFHLTSNAKLFSKALGPTAVCKRSISSNTCIAKIFTFVNSSRCKMVSYGTYLESPQLLIRLSTFFFWMPSGHRSFPFWEMLLFCCLFLVVFNISWIWLLCPFYVLQIFSHLVTCLFTFFMEVTGWTDVNFNSQI